jgi:hypothetical protein
MVLKQYQTSRLSSSRGFEEDLEGDESTSFTFSDAKRHDEGKMVESQGEQTTRAHSVDVVQESAPSISPTSCRPQAQHDSESASHPAKVEGNDGHPNDLCFVDWDGPDDPENPKNWKNWKKSSKWLIVFIVSLFSLISPLSSSMVAPSFTVIAHDLDITSSSQQAISLSSQCPTLFNVTL